MQVLNITRWPLLLVFAGAGAAVVVFAFTTVNLFTLAMANVHFVREHGWIAIREGALLQLGELCLGGSVALASWLVFKILEAEITQRYRGWAQRTRKPKAETDADRSAN